MNYHLSHVYDVLYHLSAPMLWFFRPRLNSHQSCFQKHTIRSLPCPTWQTKFATSRLFTCTDSKAWDSDRLLFILKSTWRCSVVPPAELQRGRCQWFFLGVSVVFTAFSAANKWPKPPHQYSFKPVVVSLQV